MSRLRSILRLLLKLAGIALAVLLVRKTLSVAEADFTSALSTALKFPLLLTLACYGVVNIIAAWRWKILLHVQGIDISLATAFRLTLIGVFFSNIIPGSVSGDLIKSAFIAGYTETHKAEAILTIAVDRIVGLMGLFIVAMLSASLLIAFYPDAVLGSSALMMALGAICAGGIALALGTAMILSRRWWMEFRPAKAILNFAERHTPRKIAELAGRIVAALDLYKKQPSAAIKTLALSSAIHTLLASMNFLLGKAFHETAMTPLQYIVSTQIGNVTGLFPLTPGGIGIRDAVTATFMKIFQATPEEAMALIPVAYSLTMVAWALVGAFCLILAPSSTSSWNRHNRTSQ